MCKSVCQNDVEKHPSEITNYVKIISKYTFTIYSHIFQVQQRRVNTDKKNTLTKKQYTYMIGSTTYNWYWLILEIWSLRPVQWNGTTSLKKIFLNIFKLCNI